ncbi:MAG: serine hydrolase, partial [Ketobacteraceae bacterium]|nr:serine hydrolase [Ketobacteraceae bacterium]
QYWPHGTAGVWPVRRAGIDYAAIDRALDAAFEPAPDYKKQTAAVAVAYDNRLIAEKYADTVNKNSRLLGWSMTKSFTATLIGMLHERGLVNIKSSPGIPEWEGTNKDTITIENLLHMASGLEFHEESTGPDRDLSVMLHAREHFAGFVIDRPLIAEPGTAFNYSTADSMLLASIAQEALGGAMGDTYHFIYENLFEPIGITDAVLEFDTAGYPGGGSYLSMKPRDWARLGLLYLNRGDWFGRRVFSAEWAEYATSPSPANDKYGAQIWLNTNRERWRSLPEDTFAFLGHQEQSVFIIPSRKLVVVRMGYTFGGDGEIEQLVSSIVRALPSG